MMPLRGVKTAEEPARELLEALLEELLEAARADEEPRRAAEEPPRGNESDREVTRKRERES